MLSKTSFSGHGKLGIQHSLELLPAPCGITNSDSSKVGSLKVRSFSVKVKSSKTPIPTLPNRSKRSYWTLRPNSDLDPNFWWKLSFFSNWRRECPSTTVPAFVIQPFVRQLLIIMFFSRAQAPLPPRKPHHTHSLRRQFLLRSQELKFHCYRLIRRQVHWKPCLRRHSQRIHLQLSAQDGRTRKTTALLMCKFPQLFLSPLRSRNNSKLSLAPSPVARTPSKHQNSGESHNKILKKNYFSQRVECRE